MTQATLLSVPRVAAILDCSVRTVYRMIDNGEISVTRVGKQGMIRVDAAEVERLITDGLCRASARRLRLMEIYILKSGSEAR